MEVLCRKTLRAAEETGLERDRGGRRGGLQQRPAERDGSPFQENGSGDHLSLPVSVRRQRRHAWRGGGFLSGSGRAASLDLNAVASWPLDMVSADAESWRPQRCCKVCGSTANQGGCCACTSELREFAVQVYFSMMTVLCGGGGHSSGRSSLIFFDSSGCGAVRMKSPRAWPWGFSSA